MPELPEVETVRRGLETAIKGRTIARVTLARGDLRVPFPPDFAAGLEGRHILAVERRAKYLLIRLTGGKLWVAHLGMSGRFSTFAEEGRKPGKHDHLSLQFKEGGGLVYNDARRFGLMTLIEEEELAEHPLFAKLGPEPLGKAFTTAWLEGQLARRKGPVKPVLMDASVVVGVGNIYASEALFAAGIDPRVRADSVTGKAKALIASIRKVLNGAIASGGSSLKDFVQVDGEAGYFQHHFNVYGREGKACVRCGSPVRRITQAGRSTFFCPECQR